jgi:tetratricopeptide (TPR) repeat protein
VHRKNGDIARALELLTAGLELHPNYIPASIVLGRCHQDLADLSSAEAAFAHVLRLDDENVIALKALADIGERLERYGEAENWLRRLVSVDRSNEDAREQLLRVQAAKLSSTAAGPQPSPVPGINTSREPVESTIQSPKKATAAPVSELLTVDIAAPESLRESAAPTVELPVAEAEPAESAPLPDIVALARESRPAERDQTLPDVVSIARAGAPAVEPPPDAEAPQGEELPSSDTDEPVQPLPGLISAEFQPPLEAIGGLGVETSDEVVLEVSGNSEFQVPDASEDLKSVAARLSTPSQRPPVEPREAATPVLEPTPRQPVEPPEVASSAPEPAPRAPAEPEFVVTETMAEVLARQGYAGDALRVYRELARRNGGDPRLESRIRELETAMARQPTKQHSYLARDTSGRSVAAFFHALLAARPPSGPGSAERDTGSRTEAAASRAPAENAGSLGPDGPEEREPTDAAVSFDDFFSREPDGSTPLRHGKGDPGKDDLDEFQSWLQNLKR